MDRYYHYAIKIMRTWYAWACGKKTAMYTQVELRHKNTILRPADEYDSKRKSTATRWIPTPSPNHRPKKPN
jgi:hypothetical protein